MENKNKNKKIAIYIAILIVLLGGSFIIYKIASASIDNAVISNIEMTTIETGDYLDPAGDDNLVITCDSEGKNCTNTHTASKDSAKDNILVKSFDQVKYKFMYDVEDATDKFNDIESVKVNLKISLNGDDKKYVSIANGNCNSEGLCAISDNSSYETNSYTVILNVNNAPDGYQIHPTFTFDVDENPTDTEIVLGYNTNSETGYYYSYKNGTYKSTGPANYMPTIVSSVGTNEAYNVIAENTFTQAANYDGKDGRFVTYLVGVKLNGTQVPGLYYSNNEISFKASFTQTGAGVPIVNDNWIRLYGTDIIDGIRSVSGTLPYSTSSVGEASKYIRKPGNITITKDGNSYVVKISNFDILLDRPTMNANGSSVDGLYIATVALTSFSPRLDSDGQNDINTTMTLSTLNNTPIGTTSIINRYEQLSNLDNTSQENQTDTSTSSAWYDEGENSKISTDGTGAVSKGTIVKYITKFKNNRTSSSQGVKETIKFDIDAFRVLPYTDDEDVSIQIKCGKRDCAGITKDDFEVKFVSGSFDNENYELNNITNTKLSDADKAVANTCSQINLLGLNKDQIQNLYGGPCIKAKEGIESIYDSIDDSSKMEGDSEVEIPISKVIVQTKDGVVLPDQAEVIVKVRARVRNVSDLTRTYQATTMISTSDYDQRLYYYAPQINGAISPDNYIKTYYVGTSANTSNGYIGDTLKIVNFTLRQNITVTNKNTDGSVKTKYRTVNNETITYKVETNLIDNNMNVGADDTWYIKEIRVLVRLPKQLVYIPDDDLFSPISVTEDNQGTLLEYLLITPSDKIKSNMIIKDIYFKAKLTPTLSGRSTEIIVTSEPYGININNETDTSIGKGGKFTIYGTGINEVIGTESIGESGSLIEKNGTINYVLNAYNNVGESVNDYTLINVLPYNGDDNGSNFNGTYKVKVTSDVISLGGLKCSKEVPNKINTSNEDTWEDCGDITNEFIEGITAIKLENISIASDSYMGDIIVSLKTKDNEPSDKYNNKFVGFTSESSENSSNVIEASVINRTISGVAFLDGTGDSVKDENTSYISEIPVSLYKVDNEDGLKKVADTITNENGYYEFNNLDKGRYKIRAKYDINKYDLALRYATEDINRDSDAYLIDENGTVELSDKTETSKGLVLYPPVNNITNMDIGLLPKHTFGFTMSKYITRIDLTNNGLTSTTNYDNLSTVSLSVLNPKKYTTKVYYGIAITNNSNRPGYVNLVKEDIPKGFIFDKNYSENAGWFEVDGMLGNRTLENTVVYPNETVYLQIVLFLPERDEAGAFINTASIAEISEYIPVVKNIADHEYINEDQYQVGDSLRYSGVNFHVIGVVPDGSEQILTLLADADQTSMAHGSDVYRWSTSNINYYLNNDWLAEHNINPTALIGFNICDDASGLIDSNANGGVVDANSCTSNIWTNSKVRLLTNAEEQLLRNNATNQAFLRNGGNFWLMDAVYPTIDNNSNIYDEYGVIKSSYNTSNKAKYVDSQDFVAKSDAITSSKKVRPVIRISTHNIILE